MGAVCNSDPHGYLAMNFTGRGLQMFFPGEYLVTADTDSCTGCGACLDSCLFSTLSLNDRKVVTVDARLCRGCGICRRSCPVSALTLEPRHPVRSEPSRKKNKLSV